MAKKIWYVEFPTYQYNEDVKELAREKGLTVIDAQFDDGKGVKDAPKLTKNKVKKEAEKEADKES